MDRVIEQKTGVKKIFQKKYIPYWVVGAVVIVLVYLLINTERNAVTVSKDDFTIASVKDDEFNDYIED